MIRTGQYIRREWPDPGGISGQFQIVVDIMETIMDEYEVRSNARLK